jgi:hypothetical protein
MHSKSTLIYSLILIGVIASILYFVVNKREFRIEDHAFVPPDHIEEYLAIQKELPANEHLTKFTPAYVSDADDENLENVQSPIPMKDRVPNRTGIQCVWASIEVIGRWAEEPKLVNPPLTSRAECKSYSSPTLAAKELTTLGVKFEQTYGDKAAGVKLIKKAMEEGRGCLWGVPGHAMDLIHYDEEKNVVKWIDNSDSRLAVQTTTVDKFKERWDSWVLVIYADKDIIPSKLGRSLARTIPIFDRNNEPKKYEKDYVPLPQKEDLFDAPSIKP